MHHPELLLLPILMFADYFLTVLGVIHAEKKYSQHFRLEQYELNPAWQQAIAKKQWINRRHILTTVITSAIFIVFAENRTLPEPILNWISGALLAFFGLINGQHLSNLLVFRYVIRKPGEISGQVNMGHGLALSLSLYQLLVALIPVALIAIFATSPFAIGAVLGILYLGVLNLSWIEKYQERVKQQEATTDRAGLRQS